MTQAADEIAARTVVFNDNGAWSWFQDERAIVDVAGGKILASSVANGAGAGGAARNGDIDVVSYDIATGAVQSFVLHDSFQADDHDSAALYLRPDGRYVAMYAGHTSDQLSRWRVSSSAHDLTTWGGEQTLNNGAGTTYSNLHFLPGDDGGTGRLYNFTRSVNFDPNILISSNQGVSWGHVGKLLTEGGGGDRPYVRYFSDGTRIHFITTERHPRDYDNSVYHGYIQDGQLFNSNGALLDSNLFDFSAVAPNQLTPLLVAGTNVDGAVMRRAWTVDASIDGAGNPVAVYQARANGDDTDHRFFYSRWDGTKWNRYSLAYAGSYLYAPENDYTGLVSIDPDDPNTVYLSSNVHPDTQAQLIGADGQRHYELFRGTTADGGKVWQWTPLTFNSTQDNIRPVVPQWNIDNTAVLWLRGKYNTYTNFDTEVVGLINPNVSPLENALSVDFGATGQLVQSGFNAFTRGANPGGASESESFPSDFAVGQSLVSVTVAGAVQFRDRGNGVASPVSQLVDDFVLSQDALTLAFGNLQEGDYQIVLYAHDRDISQDDFVIVNQGNNLGTLTPTTGVTPEIGVASSRVWFHADGVNDVVLSLQSPSNGNVVLNGFELYATAAPYAAPPVDLNSDGDLNLTDYLIFRNFLHSDLSGLSSQEAYARGDLNGDLQSNFADFELFRLAYDQWNGPGALAAGLAVPETHSSVMLFMGLLSAHVTRLRNVGGDLPITVRSYGIEDCGTGTSACVTAHISAHSDNREK